MKKKVNQLKIQHHLLLLTNMLHNFLKLYLVKEEETLSLETAGMLVESWREIVRKEKYVSVFTGIIPSCGGHHGEPICIATIFYEV